MCIDCKNDIDSISFNGEDRRKLLSIKDYPISNSLLDHYHKKSSLKEWIKEIIDKGDSEELISENISDAENDDMIMSAMIWMAISKSNLEAEVSVVELKVAILMLSMLLGEYQGNRSYLFEFEDPWDATKIKTFKQNDPDSKIPLYEVASLVEKIGENHLNEDKRM